ncbi:MAG: hypothetical protein ACRDLM_06225 [Gaiellaceae bacterium]
MKGLLLKGLLVAALAAAVLVPAASAKPAKAKLSVLPLPKSALGSAAKPLALDRDSGVVSNASATDNSFSGRANTFTKLGRVSGYGLDYGVGPSGGSGVTEVWTSVDQYKTAAYAKKGLAFWKKDDPQFAKLSAGGFVIAVKTRKVPAVGSSHFADLASYSAANITPVWNVDEQFTDGRYELDVTVWASSAAAATKLAPTVAKKLDARLRQALAGKLRATPVKLPAKQKSGAPAGGPDLSTLALQTSDLSGTATVSAKGYAVNPAALSDYVVIMSPAGPFGDLTQVVDWYPTANQASFTADYFTAATLFVSSASPLDLSGVGDGAQGLIENDSTGGFAQVALSSGRLAEFIDIGSQSAVQASDVQNVAQKAASYINNAGLGS